MLKLRRRLALWVGIAVGLPLIARALHAGAEALEARRGTTPAVDRMHRAGDAATSLQNTLRGRRKP